MASTEVFKHWTIKDLQDYIRENGGNPDTYGDKKDLMEEAARICIAVESKILADRANSSWTAEATASSLSAANSKIEGQPGGIAYGTPIGTAPPPYPGGPAPPFSPGIPPYAATPPYAPPPFNPQPMAGGLPYAVPPVPPGKPAPFFPYGAPGLTGPPPLIPPSPNLAMGPPPSGQFPGRRRALLCGCNYMGAPHALRGCINDVNCMAFLLTSKFGFTDADIVKLTDDQPVPQLWPTRQNMLYQMQMLLWNVQPGDSLFFHFSGHGSQVRDYTGEESDGLNETLCPCDFKQAGMIVDDEINRLLVNPLPPGVRLHAVIDACHSGSVMDLEYRCKGREGPMYWKQEYTARPRTYKGTAGGEVIQFGASRDQQTAADTRQLSGYVATGAATFSFIQAVERYGPYVRYGQLLQDMYYTLKAVNGGAIPTGGSGIFGKFLNGAMDFLGLSGQTPVMSSNQPFDFMNRPLCIL